ncbi:hypothetical protein [Flavobacterium sp. 3HN19-14]|uniref:hypothetical protein n=1 Tax=Flavobacterium sp. 3HN19-14 TaxID=3448133 RepID=UPI003EE0740E
MRKILLLLILPLFVQAQDPKDILDRITMVQSIVNNPGGQMVFSQTKAWCTEFLNFNDEQYAAADELFHAQYDDLELVYKKYEISQSPESLLALIVVFVKQEQYFRNSLTPDQLESYFDHFETVKDNKVQKNKAFNTLFMSNELIAQYLDQLKEKDCRCGK